MTIESKIENQLDRLKTGFEPARLTRPATINDGIKALSQTELIDLINRYETSNISVAKFVPASGAASRMFKTVVAAIADNKVNEVVLEFEKNLAKFPFTKQLEGNSTLDQLRFMLLEKGLNFASLPKGLIPFHKYGDEIRNPLEEQLVEGIKYALKDKKLTIHFTVPANYQSEIEHCILGLTKKYEQNGLKISPSFSVQNVATDSIAIYDDGSIVEIEGKPLLRPSGHGALIHNLSQLEQDIVFVKNIDNVTTEGRLKDTVNYKKALAGQLLFIKDKAHYFLNKLDVESSNELAVEIKQFVSEVLMIKSLPLFNNVESELQFFRALLNRPIRVCGMVKNTGEPGGGPFWVKDEKIGESLQIVESVQINLDDAEQKELFVSSTHFNPVDLVCCFKNYQGKTFDLLKYVDSGAGITTQKSYNGKPIKALELPGLWNGAMADWITLFVEVPLSTFNPVKTVFDLLRPEHQVQ